MKDGQYRLLYTKISNSKKLRFIAINKPRWYKIACNLVYTWLLPWADDDGRIKGEIFQIQANIFPHISLTQKELDDILTDLHSVKLIYWYEIDQEHYIQILDWDKNQKIRASRKKESIYPEFNYPADKCTHPADKCTQDINLSSKILLDNNKLQNKQTLNNTADTCPQSADNLLTNVSPLPLPLPLPSPSPSPYAEQSQKKQIPYKEIIDYLNLKANKHFQYTTKETQNYIKARWNQGFGLDAFKYVIDIKCKKWLTDPKMVDYLRPQTLFGTKFESYLNETKHPLHGKVSDKTIQSIKALNEWEQEENNNEKQSRV